MTDEMTFRAGLTARLDRMAAAVRITRGLDPEPKWTGGGMHPVARARQDAFHFDYAFAYPDGTGQSAKGELADFLHALDPHPHHPGFFRVVVNGVPIRLRVANRTLWNPARVWVLGRTVMEGGYDVTSGVRVCGWGLD